MSAISLPKLPAIASSPVAIEVLNGLTERLKDVCLPGCSMTRKVLSCLRR